MQLTERLRLLAMKRLYAPKNVNPKLELFFDEFDYSVQPLSQSLPSIISSMRRN